MLRKSITILVILLVAIGLLAACGGDDEPTSTPTAIPAAAEPTTEPTKEPEPTVEPTKEPEPTVAPEPTAAPVEETAAVTETAALTETAPVEEAAAVTETAALTETAPVEETAAVTETAALTETAPVEEAAAVTETAALTETAPVEETAAVTETAALTETTPVEETAAVTESIETAPEPPANLTVTDARMLADVIGVKDPVFAALSPDGSMLAFAQQTGRMFNKSRQLCIYTYENAGLTCTEAPEEYMGYPVSLVWSPDSNHVVFTENPVTLGYDSDIWILDAATGTITNRTDDGINGSYTTAAPGTALIDYMPSWNTQDGLIYFWRVVPQGNGVFVLSLNRISPTEGDVETIGNMVGSLPGKLILYDTEAYFLDGMSAVSPDGTKIAAMFTDALADPFAASRNGLYVIDISSGKISDVSELADFESFQSALPTFQYSPATPLGLSWTADSQGVLIAASSPDTHTPLILFYYVDVASGDVTPVVDFSGYDDYDTFMASEDGEIPPRYYSPWTGSLAPVGDQLLMLSDLGGIASILAAPLPPTGELPPVIGSTDEFISTGGSSRSTRSSDGKVTMYGLQFTVVEE